MGRRKLTAGRDPNLPFICLVCGDIARGNNFSVLSCVSCKSFFRRHGLLKLDKLHCKHNRVCIINKETRGNCLPCRLKKCLAVGMDPQMIRCPPSLSSSRRHRATSDNKTITTTTTTTSPPASVPSHTAPLLPPPRPVDLLIRHDRSTLTSDQWTLLSNIIRSYDQQNLIERIRHTLNSKSSLPVKLRTKSSDTLTLISEPLKSVVSLIEYSSHYHHLSLHARQRVKINNLFFTGAINGYLVAKETNAFHNPIYMTACSALYGDDYMLKCAQDHQRFECNGNLVKLFLFVLMFSSNCSIVFPPAAEEGWSFSKVMTMKDGGWWGGRCVSEVVEMQDMYVTMLWKYMVYQFGHDGAVVRYAGMVKSLLDMFRRVEELPLQLLCAGMSQKMNLDSCAANDDTIDCS